MSGDSGTAKAFEGWKVCGLDGLESKRGQGARGCAQPGGAALATETWSTIASIFYHVNRVIVPEWYRSNETRRSCGIGRGWREFCSLV